MSPVPIPIPLYVPSYGNIPNVTPFTFRDGLSYEQRFVRLVQYINNKIVAYVSENYSKLSDEFVSAVNGMISQVNDALGDLDGKSVEQAIAELTAYVNDQVNLIINDSVEVQDPVVAALIADVESASRAAIVSLMGDYATVESVATIEQMIEEGRLSDEALSDKILAASLRPKGQWGVAISYTVNDVVFDSGSSYIAKANHTAASSNRPGIGIDWASFWTLLAQGGRDGEDANTSMTGGIPGQILKSNGDSAASWVTPGKNYALGMASLPMFGSAKEGNLIAGTNVRQIQGDDVHYLYPMMTVAPNGELIVLYRRASVYSASDGVIMMSRSKNFGDTWSTPVIFYDHPSRDIREFSISTLKDGRLLIHYVVGGATEVGDIYIMFSDDNGYNWTDPVKVPFTFNNAAHAASAPVETADGRILVHSWGRNSGETYWSIRQLSTTNDGVSWSSETTVADGPGHNRMYNETCFDVLPNGHIMGVIRVSNDPNITGINDFYRVVSTDNGTSWSEPQQILTGISGRPTFEVLASGGIVMCPRRLVDNATVFMTSWDDGLTWTSGQVLHEVPAYSGGYAAPVEVSPGLIAVAFADTESTTLGKVRFKYLVDGKGITPLGDTVGFVVGVDVTGVTEIFIPAQSFNATNDTPTMGWITGNAFASGMNFSGTGTDIAASNHEKMPNDWNTFEVHVLWAPHTATAGGVRWAVTFTSIIGGNSLNTNSESKPVNATNPLTAGQVVDTVITGYAGRQAPFSVRVARVTTDAWDTYPDEAMLLGLRLVKTS